MASFMLDNGTRLPEELLFARRSVQTGSRRQFRPDEWARHLRLREWRLAAFMHIFT